MSRGSLNMKFVRSFSRTSVRFNKVCIIGAAGGIGQPLSLLLKCSPLVKELRLYDVAPITVGVAKDLSHINTGAITTGFTGQNMADALKDCDVVIIPAGVPRKPGMTRDDLFNTNANIVKGIAEIAASVCPKAMFCVISNPVNSMVPVMAETLRQHKVYDSKRMFGVTTLDITRANTFVAENQKLDVSSVKVTVIGGHAGTTIIPLLSQLEGKFSQEDRDKLTQRVMFGGEEVVTAKGSSATLSMAYAGAEFAIKLMRAMKGEKNIVECAFVESNLFASPFFACPVLLGPSGIEKVLGTGPMNEYETKLVDAMKDELKSQVMKGIEFASKK